MTQQEQDLRRLEQAVALIPEVEAELRRQEQDGRLLVWFPGLVLVVLVGIDLHRTSAPWTDCLAFTVAALLLAMFVPLKRKWEIDAQKAWLAILEQARDIMTQARA